VRVVLLRAAWTLLGLLLVLAVLKSTLADVYRVGSGSMRPTIFGGADPRTGEVFDERVLVRYGGAQDLERFDLAVVRRDPEPPIVKRVVGLPGESIAIAGGDVIIDGARLPLDAPRPAPVLVFDEALHDLAQCFNLRQAPAGPWSPEDGVWRLDARAVAAGSDAGMMLFEGELRDDYLDVDGRSVTGRREVNDARVECEARLDALSGALRLRLVEAGDTFEARIEAQTDGRVFALILRFNSASLQDPENVRNKIEVLAQAQVELEVGAWQPLAFENVDNHLVLDVAGRRIAADYAANAPYPGPKPRGQTSLGARVGLGGEACAGAFRRVRILRDLFYVPVGEHGVGEGLALGPSEYFVLGDNSSDSRDSRMFGPVPAEEIAGRPVLVVWPWSRRRMLGDVAPR
jgi:hypothetical protein